MIALVVPSVVLGLVAVAAVTASVLGRHRSSAAQVRAPGPGAGRQKALEAVARGLRSVAQGCAESASPLPVLRAVVCSRRRLTLRLAGASGGAGAGASASAPAPWTVGRSGEEWSVAPASLRRTGNGGSGRVPHPYSLTVTLGLCGGDWVLVDLSRLSGGISLTGDLADVRCLAQAVITELASGPVGALAEVVLVGSAAAPSVTDGLAVRSARLHTAPTRDAALLCAEDLPPAPASASSASRRTSRLLPGGRGPATAGTDTRRLFVVTAAEFRDGKWAETPLRGTDALLILGHVPDAAWNFHVNTDGSLDTGRLGLRIDTHTAIAG